MKIGILTLPLHTNYGGILQNYALQKILKREGHDVVTLNKSMELKLPVWKKTYVYLYRIIKKYLFNISSSIFIEDIYNKNYQIIIQNIKPFVEKNICSLNVKRLEKLDKDLFDAIIVGSDQIWRPSYYPNIENAFLKFAYSWNIKRIAYAPSFGTDVWEFNEEQTKNCSKLIRRFDYVSVREDSGRKLCSKYLNITPQVVLDPTMLLKKEDYLEVVKGSSKSLSNKHNYLLVYILDLTNDKQRLIDKVSEILNLPVVYISSKVENETSDLDEKIQISIEEWLLGFENAEYVITDSFHATVFSILFNKSFVVYGNKKRGLSRFDTLLEKFQLRDRIVFNSSDLVSINLLQQIDWYLVNSLLDSHREKSLSYLFNALSE